MLTAEEGSLLKPCHCDLSLPLGLPLSLKLTEPGLSCRHLEGAAA